MVRPKNLACNVLFLIFDRVVFRARRSFILASGHRRACRVFFGFPARTFEGADRRTPWRSGTSWPRPKRSPWTRAGTGPRNLAQNPSGRLAGTGWRGRSWPLRGGADSAHFAHPPRPWGQGLPSFPWSPPSRALEHRKGGLPPGFRTPARSTRCARGSVAARGRCRANRAP